MIELARTTLGWLCYGLLALKYVARIAVDAS
jgi:hypothetical protein